MRTKEEYEQREKLDAESALANLRSVEGFIRSGNYLMAISLIGSISVSMAQCESFRTIRLEMERCDV